MTNVCKEQCAEELRRVGVRIDGELEKLFAEAARGEAARMYKMLAYFMGFIDEEFAPKRLDAGKRFRSALALFIAESYGAASNAAAFDAALAIELFHNFTLIHDDVEDRDEMRRGRPTLWKLWGINHAINSGDAQSLIAAQLSLRASRGNPDLGEALLAAFIEVIEGQYLDFELADAPLDTGFVNEENYTEMIEKKSGALIGIAAEAAGIASGKDAEEQKNLRQYGRNLGIAYQMTDDYNSVWATSAATGKDLMSDIREHKRTLPFLYARSAIAGAAKRRLEDLYSLPRQLSDIEVQEAYALLNTQETREYVQSRINEYANHARNAAQMLTVSENKKATLAGIVDMLVLDSAKK